MARLDSNPPIFFDSGIRHDETSPATRRTKMKKIRRNWNRKPISDRIDLAGTIVANQKKTPKILPHDDPRLPELDAAQIAAKAKDDLVKSLEEQLKVARTQRQEATDAMVALLEPNASFVEATAESEADIVEVGYELVADAAPVGPMPQPQDFALTAGDNEGELDWQCHSVEGATGMELATTQNPNDNASWVAQMPVARSSGTVTGQTPGARIYARVRAHGPLGPGPWSDIASRRAP